MFFAFVTAPLVALVLSVGVAVPILGAVLGLRLRRERSGPRG